MSSILIPASIKGGVAQKFKILLSTSLLCAALLFTSAGATLESDVSAIKSDVNTIDTNISRIYSILNNYISDIYSRLGSINTSVSAIQTSLGYGLGSTLSSISSDTSVIRTNSAGINTIVTQLSSSGVIGSKVNSNNTLLGLIQTQTDDLEGYSHNLDYNVARIAGFLDNASHHALEQASEDSVDEATSMYQSQPNGQSTANNNAAISGFSSSIASGMSTGVSSDDAWNYLSSGDPGYSVGVTALFPDNRDRSIFAFFSSDTLYDLDPSANTRSAPAVVDYFSPNWDIITSHQTGDDQR